MAPYTAILRQLTPERFTELMVPLNRQSKERYFARHGVRAPKASVTSFARPGQKNEQRCKGLHQSLQKLDDEPLAEDLLRQYLITHRAMLAAALDYLKIPHEDGLTESPELAKFANLDDGMRPKLIGHLVEQAKVRREDAELYLDFMAVASQAE